MTIEKLGDMQIAYMRRTGGYGEGNRQLMEQFKRYLREHALLQEDTTILGIALDDPAQIPEDRQRYDVGMILTGREDPCGLPVRTVAGGRWAVFEVPHSEEGVSDFWRDLPQRGARLPVDGTRPILERYAHPKVSAHICEFCVPLRESKLRGI